MQLAQSYVAIWELHEGFAFEFAPEATTEQLAEVGQFANP
jgi:hypothetical protein